MRCLRCTLTVSSLRTMTRAISRLRKPRAARRSTSTSRSGEVGAGGVFGEARGDGGRDHAPAGCGCADRADQLRAQCVLDQVAADTGLQRAVDVGITGKAGEGQDARFRVRGQDGARGGDAAEPGHAQVHDHDVRLVQVVAGDGFRAVDGFGDNRDVGFDRNQRRNTSPHDRVIIGCKNTHTHAQAKRRARSGNMRPWCNATELCPCYTARKHSPYAVILSLRAARAPARCAARQLVAQAHQPGHWHEQAAD